jgi:membrane fusion protein (multidrug efflux system)
MRKISMIVGSVTIALVLVGTLAGIKWMQIQAMVAQAQQMTAPAATVSVALAQSMRWRETLDAVGTVTALQGTVVRAEVSGRIARLAFDSGQKVRAGGVLVVQESTEEAAQLRAAQAAAQLAALDAARGRRLAAEAVISQADLDRLEAVARQSQAQAEALAAHIAKKTVRAPFDGMLGIRRVSLGQSLAPGDAIVEIYQQEPLQVEFSLTQEEAVMVAPGLPVEVELGEKLWPGALHSLEPQADAATRTVRAVARLATAAPDLRPGMFVRVRVIQPEPRTVLAIPATAVLSAPYGDSVFVVEQGPQGQVVRQSFVRLGARQGDFVEVISGLTSGERVVSSGVFRLRSGQQVVVTEEHDLPAQLQPQPANE